MFPTPDYVSADPLREFRKLTRFEQRKIVEKNSRKPGVSVGRVTADNLDNILRILEGNSFEASHR